jgi:hypothetical protein
MTLPGFIALIIIVTMAVLVFIEIAGMPGRSARARNHPEAEAIALLGWLGLPLGVVPWLVAIVWARMQPISVKVTNEAALNKTAIVEDTAEDSSSI